MQRGGAGATLPRMAIPITCPKCNNLVYRGGFPAWVWIVAILLFPLGLIAFAAGRKPTRCGHCGYTFVA